MHGSYGSLTHWAANIDALAQSNRVVALDLPGFGESSNIPQGSGLDVLARSVLELADFLRIGGFALGGFSFGGMVCTEVVRLAAEMVHSLVLVSPPMSSMPNDKVKSIQAELGRIAVSQSLKKSAETMLNKLFLVNSDRITEEAIAITIDNLERTQFRARPLLYKTVFIDELARVKCRTLSVIGKKDPFQAECMESHCSTLRSMFGDDSVKLIPSGGHWVNYDTPDVVNGIISCFANQLNTSDP